MKKITLSLVFLLAMIMSGYGQVTYNFGWEPTATPMGGWTTTSPNFARQTATPCSGIASARANIYYGSSSTLTSPLLGTSNGGLVNFSFEYKAVDYYATSTGVPATDFVINAEWANSLTGPWFTVGTIDADTHEVSGTCATVTYTFTALPGNLFVRMKVQTAENADMYVHFDTVSVTQGAPPTCISPSSIAVSNLLSTSATITWNAPTEAPALGYEYFYSDVNATPSAAGTATTNLIANLTTLSPNTKYYVYVRSMCTGEQSVWFGPFVFRTPCESFGIPFLETFDSTSDTEACWTVVNANGDAAQWDMNYTSAAISGNQSAVIITDYLQGANDDWLISPKITLTGNERLKFKYKSQSSLEPNDFMVKLSTTGNTPADFTTVLMPLTEVNNTNPETKVISLTAYTGDVFVAFHVPPGGVDGWRLYIDDILFELTPTDAPICIEDMNAEINEGCGNFPTIFTWAAVPSTDGYKVSIGTSPNGQDLIVDNEDIGSNLTYSFVGNPGTEYFYTIRPYAGDLFAVDCYEDTFTTYDDGCYCEVAPEYLDGQGISLVQVGSESFVVNPVSYMDLTEDGAVEVTQGINNVMNITFLTGYTYNTNVWIDFNDNYTFEPSELVYVGESLSPVGTVLNTSFFVPTTTIIGQHQMRIVATDNLQTPANPCYNASYGIVIDLLVDVQEAPDCLPPTSSSASNVTSDSAVLNWVSDGTLFNVEVDFAGFAQGTGVVTEGISGLTTMLTELDPQADYSYYLQTDCGDGSLSPWTGPYNFRTGCESFGDFTEDFTTEVNYFTPECWYSDKGTADPYAYIQVYSFSQYMQFYNSADVSANMYLVTPSLTALPLDTHRIKFRAYSPTAGNTVVIGTMSDPSDNATFTAVQTIQLTNAFADYAVAFLNSTTDMHVAFKFVGTGTYQYLYLDDVVWEEAPTCPDIYVVSFDGSTPYTADISWAAGGGETAWQYVYALAAETDPNALTPFDVATTASTTIVDLMPSSTYKVWIRAACGTDGFGNWSPAKTFTTACVPVTAFPWTESFESVTTVGTAFFPLCWSKENGDYATASGGSYNSARTGTKYLRNSWTATNEYMWTPGFELTAGVSYDFSFYTQGDGFTGWDVDVFQNTVQNSTGATQIGTTVTASGTGSTSMQPYALVKNTIVPTTSGTYYFAVRTNQPSSSAWYIAFDDFRMEPTPSCIAPIPPTSANATVTTATMNWTATTQAPANGYDYYVTSDFTSTPNAATVPTGTVGAGITTAELTGLTGATVYKIYVRAICSSEDKSSWSDAGSLTTVCVTATLPYTINFDNVTAPNLPICTTVENAGSGNNWKTAGAPGHGFTTNVLAYEWSVSEANAWFFTNTVSLVAGTTYSVSYDYGNDFDFYNESLKVSYGTTANSIAMTTEIANHPAINSADLQSNSATFTPATSGDYVIGFNAYSASFQNFLYLDNILIEEVLGASDFDNKSFTAYPNPVKDILNVSSTQNISDVAVYNLLGQQVLFMNINANKGQVDMSSLSAGTYLVKVNSDNGVKTIKVIKE